VPAAQVRDTVELWRLPHQRKISLRFLASYLLKADIQDEIHDSVSHITSHKLLFGSFINESADLRRSTHQVEDAKTALLLFRRYEEVRAQGQAALDKAQQDLYDFGGRTNWTIGLTNSPQAVGATALISPRKQSRPGVAGALDPQQDRIEAMAAAGGRRPPSGPRR
jgi:hypothetical protein